MGKYDGGRRFFLCGGATGRGAVLRRQGARKSERGLSDDRGVRGCRKTLASKVSNQDVSVKAIVYHGFEMVLQVDY